MLQPTSAPSLLSGVVLVSPSCSAVFQAGVTGGAVWERGPASGTLDPSGQDSAAAQERTGPKSWTGLSSWPRSREARAGEV